MLQSAFRLLMRTGLAKIQARLHFSTGSFLNYEAGLEGSNRDSDAVFLRQGVQVEMFGAVLANAFRRRAEEKDDVPLRLGLAATRAIRHVGPPNRHQPFPNFRQGIDFPLAQQPNTVLHNLENVRLAVEVSDPIRSGLRRSRSASAVVADVNLCAGLKLLRNTLQALDAPQHGGGPDRAEPLLYAVERVLSIFSREMAFIAPRLDADDGATVLGDYQPTGARLKNGVHFRNCQGIFPANQSSCARTLSNHGLNLKGSWWPLVA